MIGLAFSGGKDSLACWYLCKQFNPIVFWVNTGKAYPETQKLVNEIKKEAFEFVEICTDQQKNIDDYGIPSDLVPINFSPIGMIFNGTKSIKVQSYLDCCWTNISQPLMKAIKDKGITQLIRGQRNDEDHKATSRNGTVIDEITFLHPIEEWSKQQVLDFIKEKRGSLPEHFFIDHSSLDCYDCTGYLDHSQDRIKWTKNKHPDLYEKYANQMERLKTAIAPTLKLLEQANG